MEKEIQKRFVLVHGLCHGAWTWYKLKMQLEAAGHCVTAVDLAASGINMTRLDEIQTLMDYSKPLLDILSSLGSDEDKVILVAHSMGGIPVAMVADIFPSKIAAIVFVSSFMPDTRNPPAYVLENDLVLATMLVRANPVVTNNLAGTKSFSEERYGSVTRIYIICGEDNMIPGDYQRWMISNFPVKEVMEIKDADHMVMFSKTQELCARLLGIADKYA
ncbi:putative methylesterase 19 isoform X2 [Raphanus sativus]|uniref:Methylesterase 19 isoform X2 n=1 Tax=Raphanus sativus TaxID=3726 RepID=A0A6J0MUU4_RAPSA|nr:putative methylesterase 19 isoform X2 [Raphanus sativus]